MTTITAAAGGGSWSAGGSWVGGVAPTAADDVLLTVTSGNITIDGTSGSPNLCRSLDCTGYTGTLTQASAKVLNVGDGTVGNFKLVAGMTYVPNIGSTINFVSTTGTNNITTAAKAMGKLVFNGAGGSWQFQDGYTNTTFGNSITLTQGTLDMNGKTFSLSTLTDGGSSSTRSLTLGAASITINDVWLLSSSGLTFSGASSTITTGISGTSITSGGGTYGTITSGQSTILLLDAMSCATFSWGNFSGTAGTLSLAGNLTVSGTFTSNGSSLAQSLRNTIISSVRGTSRTITAATVTCIYSNFRDITGAGAGSWNLAAITGLSGDCGGNSGITFTTPIDCYMKVGASANWSASANWYTTSGGAVLARVPLPQDTAIFDANSITAGSVTITRNMPHTSGMTWAGVTNTPAFNSGGGAWDCYGGIVLVSGMTHTGAGVVTFNGRGSFNIDGGGLTWPTTSDIIVNAPTGTYTFTTAFTSNAALTETSGNITTSSTLSCTTLTVTSGTFTVGGNITLTGALSVTGTLTDGTGTTYTISGGTTVAVPAGGSLTIGTFSGTGSSNLIAGTAVFGTLTLTLKLETTSATSNITIGAGGATCQQCNQNTAGASLTTGSGLINCSGSSGLAAGTVSLGSGGLTCTAATLGATLTLNLGSGTITLTGTGTVWNAAAGVVINGQTSTIHITDTSATTKTFTSRGQTYNNLTIDGAASNGTVTISGGTYNTLTCGANSSILFSSNATHTISHLVCNGTSGHVVTFAATSSGQAATLSCANAVDVDYMSIKDSTASGNTPFYAGANSTSVSGNTNWTFTIRPTIASPVGVVGTATFGSSTISLSKAVTGVSGTGTVGNPVINSSGTSTGVSATGQLGSALLQLSAFYSGVVGTASVGSIIPQQSEIISGLSASCLSGNVALELSQIISAIVGTASVGSIVIQIFPAISGVEATGSIGSVTIDTTLNGSVNPTGAYAVGYVGQMGVSCDVEFSISGIECTGIIGDVALDLSPNYSGIECSGYLASVENSIDFLIESISALGIFGEPEILIIGGMTTVNIPGIYALGQIGHAEFPDTVYTNGAACIAYIGTTLIVKIQNYGLLRQAYFDLTLENKAEFDYSLNGLALYDLVNKRIPVEI